MDSNTVLGVVLLATIVVVLAHALSASAER